MNRLVLVLGILVFFQFITAQSFAFMQEDVAVHLITGETFVIERANNPYGKLLILNDKNEAYQHVESLQEVPDHSAVFEVEMSRHDLVTYLIQSGQGWYLNGLQRELGGEWKKLATSFGISGAGEARGLTSLPDGRIALTVARYDSASMQEQVLVIDPADFSQNAKYNVLDAVSANVVEARTKMLMELFRGPKEDTPVFGTENGIGFAAGAQAGVGIAYRRHLEDRWGIQIVGIGFSGNGNSAAADLGVTVMHTLSKTQYTRFYALAGASIFYQGSQNYYYAPMPMAAAQAPAKCSIEPGTSAEGASLPISPCDTVMYPTPTPQAMWNQNVTLNFGIGIGMEFTIAKNLGLAFELPITVMYTANQYGTSFNGIYPIPNAALIYYF
jgi:hypothetical protein